MTERDEKDQCSIDEVHSPISELARRRFLKIAGLSAGGIAMGLGIRPGIAHALPPVRSDTPLTTFVLEDVCPFDILVEPLANRNRGKQTTFFDRDGNQRLSLVTGSLAVRLTNLDSPNRSLVLNIPGPGVYLDNGQSAIFRGPWLIFLPRGSVPGSPALLFINGRTLMTFFESGLPSSISWVGMVQDVCAALSAT